MNFDTWVFNNILNNKLQELVNYIDSKLYYLQKENQLIIYDIDYEKEDIKQNIESLKIIYISKGWKDLYFNKEDELILQII